jgi:hypothetical protein
MIQVIWVIFILQKWYPYPSKVEVEASWKGEMIDYTPQNISICHKKTLFILNYIKHIQWVCLINVFLAKNIINWYKDKFLIYIWKRKRPFCKTFICSYNVYYVNQWKIKQRCVFFLNMWVSGKLIFVQNSNNISTTILFRPLFFAFS